MLWGEFFWGDFLGLFVLSSAQPPHKQIILINGSAKDCSSISAFEFLRIGSAGDSQKFWTLIARFHCLFLF